jgi:SSS family solute:Na+ symporter
VETQFYLVDKIILFVYFIGIVLLGVYFRKRSNTANGFMIASGRLPSWAVGLSMLGTFISSITFIGYPGQAYNFNWDAFMFSFSLPFAALVAMVYFIPLYRTKVKVSAYEYLEQRFGGWARVYGSISFMFGSLTRIGMVLFLVSLVLNSLTGWSIIWIILITGVVVTFYTMIGGIEAVIWTDVTQVIVLMGGAILTTILLLIDIPGGAEQIIAIGNQHDKFSLGSWDLNLIAPTAWVVLLYGIMENLRNFGVDQNYVQRYHTTANTKDAVKSVWMAALTYIPISALFLFIGSALFAFYVVYPDQLTPALQGEMMGDKIFPHFIVTQLPVGVRGILIAAIVAAAMSSIDSSLNTVSTLTLLDFYKRYFKKGKIEDDKRDIKMLRWYTVIWGVAGTITGFALMRIQSALETGWQLGGIAGGGVIGLFLLAIGFSWIKRWQAATAVIASVISIAWATFARDLPDYLSWLECTWNARMIGVIGTVTLLVVGIGLGLLTYRKKPVSS